MGKKRKLPDLDDARYGVVTVVLDRETERVTYFHPATSEAEAYAALTAAQAASEDRIVASALDPDDD